MATAAWVSAGEPEKRKFDVPADLAEKSLRVFSVQSGSEVLFSSDAASGVRTNAIKGEFLPGEAVKKMLTGTTLYVRDERDGVFRIAATPRPKAPGAALNPGQNDLPGEAKSGARSRDPPPGPSSAAQPNQLLTSQPQHTESPPMKNRNFFALLAAWLVASPATYAQTTSGPAKDEAIVLSPFTVSTERDNGFVAASSLAGGRLASDLRDTPVAYSVITRDFIDALGLDNVSDAATWTANTVGAVSTLGGGKGEDAFNSPGTFNVRGNGAGRGQRNFFTYTAPNDSYSVERFDFSRGPNAILFGNGSLGGVATTTTKQARFDRTFGELALRLGSYSDKRATLDYNRPIGDKAAVRVAVVDQDSGGWRTKQFNKIKAIFLTGSAKLSPTTTLRIDAEYGEVSRNQTFTNLNDQFAGWDGKTTFSGPLDTLPSNSNALGFSRRGAGYQIYDPFSGQNAIMNYQNDPITMAGGANGLVPIAGFFQGSMPSFGSAGANLLYAINVPANRFDNAIAGSAFRLPSRSFSLASDAPLYAERFKDLQFTLDQKVGPFYLQVAADINRTQYQSYGMDIRGAANTYIDINRLLPNGANNPHFLQPYGDGQLRRWGGNHSNGQARFALGYAKDAGKWGVYTSSLLGGYSDRYSPFKAYNVSIAQNPDHRRWGASSSGLPATDIVRIRRYWNEPSRPLSIPNSVRYIDPITGGDKSITPFWAIEEDRNDSVNLVTTRSRYTIAALNAKYFNNRLVFLGAVRVDDFYAISRQQINGGDYSATSWDGITPVIRPDPPSDYASLTYFPKSANGVANGARLSADTRPRDGNGTPLPQYANDRFKNDFNAPAQSIKKTTRTVGTVVHVLPWLSPFINYAETFNNNATIQRIDSTFLPPTVAKGVDLGLRANLFGGRINAAITRYTNTEKNAAAGAAINSGSLNAILTANKLDNLGPATLNEYGLSTIPSSIQDIKDRLAEGYEVEVVANVTKQWRLSANLGVPKVYDQNAFRDEIAYFEKNLPTLRRIMTEAGALIDSTDQASRDPSIPDLDARSPFIGSAISNWNSIRLARLNMISGKRLGQDQRSINVYSDYTIAAGLLRALRVGLGVQYRGKLLIGYRAADTIVNPANPATAIDNPNVDAYTPVYTPKDYFLTNATLGYAFRLKERRELRFDLRVSNLLNDLGPIYGGGTVLRPLKGDYTSPARETVANVFSYKDPFSISLTTTLKF